MRSIQEVSKRLGISRSLVYAEIHVGNLHAHRFGKRTYRISDEDLASYVEQHGHTAVLPTDITSPAAKSAAGTPKSFKHLKISPRSSGRQS